MKTLVAMSSFMDGSIRHRDLSSDLVKLNGIINTRPDLQTPSEFYLNYGTLTEITTLEPTTQTNYSITGFTIEFQR